MTKADVPQIVRKCIARRFGVDVKSITDKTVAADVPGWDSLAYAELLMMIEQSLDVMLPVNQLLYVEDVGALTLKIQEQLR